MVTIDITITEEQARELQDAAWGRGLSVAAYVVAIHRAVLEAEALEGRGQRTGLGSVWELADFTPRDVAVNHDEYWAITIWDRIAGQPRLPFCDDRENDEQPVHRFL